MITAMNSVAYALSLVRLQKIPLDKTYKKMYVKTGIL